jgi:hypothetical protein
MPSEKIVIFMKNTPLSIEIIIEIIVILLEKNILFNDI